MSHIMPEVGSRFGNYEIERLLDHGGMGYVYLVRHPVLRVERALKVLDPHKVGTKAEFVERFNREAQLVCQVHHPRLVEVHDAGLDEETGLRYIVMEYVPGGTLRGRLKARGYLPWREALGIVRQTAEALAAVARRGSVHRDIKPENIMFAADGGVKLADFGIAKAVANDTEDTLETQSDQAFGTPAYMSPEQARSAATVDARADIWSLGVVLFEMLSGVQPYRAESAIGILAALLNDRPFPDVRAARAGNASPGGVPSSVCETLPPDMTAATVSLSPADRPSDEIPDAVVRLLNDMCTKDLRRRISAPDEVIRRIDAICGTPPARTTELPPVAAAPHIRRSVWFAAAAALAVAALGFLVWRGYSAHSARVPEGHTAAVTRRPPEVPPSAKPEVPPSAKPEVRPVTKPEARPEIQPADDTVPVVVTKKTDRRKPELLPLSAGCTVSIGAPLADAIYRPADGMSALGRSVAEAISARAGLVILSPAAECARARTSRNGYALKLAEVCDALRAAGIACRYRRSAGTSGAAMRLDAAAEKVCSFRSIACE